MKKQPSAATHLNLKYSECAMNNPRLSLNILALYNLCPILYDLAVMCIYVYVSCANALNGYVNAS